LSLVPELPVQLVELPLRQKHSMAAIAQFNFDLVPRLCSPADDLSKIQFNIDQIVSAIPISLTGSLVVDSLV